MSTSGTVPVHGARMSRLAFIVIIIAVVALSVIIIYASPYLFTKSTSGPGLLHANCNSVSNNSPVVHTASGGSSGNASFLIVETDPPSPLAGINGSYFVPTSTQWPVLHVRVNQTVTIHVINCASSESHGFQIQHYDDHSIISIQPGQSYDVTFVASKAGTFKVFCDIFCAIHAFMQNGSLIVS